MNIRSLLLGSIAAAGLSTAGYAADLGVVTSLDVCDELGLSGLTISSDDTCLVISGSVEFSMTVGTATSAGVPVPPWQVDDVRTDATVGLDFKAVSPTDFGPATAFISLTSAWDDGDDGFEHVDVDEAYVSVGDTTVVTAGYVSSLFESTVDVPDGAYDFDFFGPAFKPYGVSDDGNVMSFNVTHSVGDGFSVGGALESEVVSGTDNLIVVGVASYAGNGIAAQGNFAYDTVGGDYGVYGAFQGYFDPATIVATISADGTDWVGQLGAAVTVDIFTLSGSVKHETSVPETTLSGKVAADVTDTVSINVKSSYLVNAATWTLSAGVDVDVTETLTASAEIGTNSATSISYAKGTLTWEPVADTSFAATGTVWSNNLWTAKLSASREFD